MTMAIRRSELIADFAVHAVGIALGAVGTVAMLIVAQPDQLLSVAIYLVGLTAMLGCSALYHVWLSCRRRDWLRRLDHAAIFVMIAGTYTPLVLRLPDSWGVGLTAAIWALAIVGIGAKLCLPHRVETLSVPLYLALGWAGLVAIGPLLRSLSATTLALLLAGGAVYSLGVLFHMSARIRYSRALWHSSVLIAAAVHYAAVMSLLEA